MPFLALPELPAGGPMCYKPYMRKWMRDKLNRRKKTPEETAAQPAPLQPAYFEPGAQEPPQESREVESQEPEPASVAEDSEAPSAAASTGVGQPVSGQAQRPRRRRGRGGRGRKRTGAQSASAAPAADSAPAASAAVAGAAPPAAQRPSKGVGVLAVGLPGSGKSSWFKRHNISPLSSDLLRSLLFDDPAEQRFQDLVFSNLRSMLKARLIARRPTNYVDATNLTPQERQHWIKLAKDFGYEVHAVFFDVPLEVCIERHHRRDRLVPEDVMRKMAAKLKAPTFDEGFAKITVVRVKHKAEG
jgi:predicted kinase